MKKKLLILAGGYSKEREISFKTAKAVFKQIKKDYICKIIDPKNGFIKEIRKFKPQVIFNALHGRYGEDGYVQLILENEKIKYTHSGVEASSICINKIISKEIFKKYNILSPKYLTIKGNMESNFKKIYYKIKKKFKFPVVIKPNKQGSTFGLTIVKNELQLPAAIKEAFKFGDEIIVEEYIPGREVTIPILGDEVYPIIEIVPSNELYDLGSTSKKWRHLHAVGITASGDISSSGTIIGDIGQFNSIDLGAFLSITASGDISTSGAFIGDGSQLSGIGISGSALDVINITSSGTISSSATGSFEHLVVSGDISGAVSASGTGSFQGGIDAAGATGSFGFVSASGDISASGTGHFGGDLHLSDGDIRSNNTIDLLTTTGAAQGIRLGTLTLSQSYAQGSRLNPILRLRQQS